MENEKYEIKILAQVQQKAEYVYIGSSAKKCIKYSKMFDPFSQCILSTKYGFIFPDDIVF